jgi:hypothetical protein
MAPAQVRRLPASACSGVATPVNRAPWHLKRNRFIEAIAALGYWRRMIFSERVANLGSMSEGKLFPDHALGWGAQ